MKVCDIKDKKTLELFLKIIPSSNIDDNLSKYEEKITEEFFSMKVNTIIFDSRQLGLKVSANSLYGFLGAQVRGKFSMIEASMAVTSRGRELIIESGLYFEKRYGATVVYGDSILGDEPVLLKYNNSVFMAEISSLVLGEENWFSYNEFKFGENNRTNKQQYFPLDLYSWSKGSWNKIKRIIRHKTNKSIYRIKTLKGTIDVTEDHSLLNDKWEIIKPQECIINKTKLAHSYPIIDELVEQYNNPDFKDKLEEAKYYYYLKSINKTYNGDDERIKSIELIYDNYTDFVYDIETENGFFQAGIGEINVKNTDSVMIYVPTLTDYTKIYEVAKEMEMDINGYEDIKDEEGNIIKPGKKGIFFAPLYLEFEKAMKSLYMKKKHYVYMEYDKNGEIIKEKNSDLEKLNVKGILLARRDNCQWIRRTYEKIIRTVFSGGTIQDSFKIIIGAIIDLIEVNLDITKDLSIVKSMGSNYKSENYPLALMFEVMKELGRPLQPGERFPYVIVRDYLNRDRIGYKMRTNELFEEEWSTSGFKYGDKIPEDFESELGLFPPEEIDLFYYINNVFMIPIDKLFNYGYLDIIKKYEAYDYQARFRKIKPVSVMTPVAMVVMMIKDYQAIYIEKEVYPVLLSDLRDMITWFDNIKIDFYLSKDSLKSI
jgi:hypothetical protein